MRFKRIPVEKELLIVLAKRQNILPALHVALRFSLIAISLYGSLHFLSTSSYVTACFFILFNGVFFSFLGWAGIGHELLHSTYFHNKALNKIFLVICSVASWNNWKYHEVSHRVHHVRTMITGVDGEFSLDQPKLRKPDALRCLLFDYVSFHRTLTFTVQNAFDVIKGEWGATHFPAGSAQRREVVVAARITLGTHLTILLLSIALWSPLFLLVSLAPFTCNLFSKSLTLAQHIGMKADVDDFSENSRTVVLPAPWSFLYCNMNYHIEHHMYPSIPYFNLPRLHAQIKDAYPVSTGMMSAISVAME